MATTVTPGRTAPLLSATLPLICAVAWAHALVETRRSAKKPSSTRGTRPIQSSSRRDSGLANVGEMLHLRGRFPYALTFVACGSPLLTGHGPIARWGPGVRVAAGRDR